MRVRTAKKEDFVEVHKLLLSVFPNAMAKIKENDEFLIAEENEIMGFAHITELEDKILLNGFGVGEKFRGKGAGSAIMDVLIRLAKVARKNVYLKTKVDCPALPLYRKKGFIVKRLKNDVYTMILKFAN
ncbi:GNAT family N-acetyltransferase [Candidatus Micrarchaeota archaeon]|nr:GNAT family N-acetyltransferase [Candidatus Micrarchaeota archaeon]